MFKKQPWYISIWNEGKYLDFWSINHIISGFLLGEILYFLKINFWLSLAISITIMIAWEVYEIFKNIHETCWNRLSDLIVGMIGFLTMYHLFLLDNFNHHKIVFILCIIVWLFLELWGYIAYKIKNK